MAMDGWDGYYRRLAGSLRSENNLKAAETASLKSAIDETERKIRKIESNPVYRVLRSITGGNRAPAKGIPEAKGRPADAMSFLGYREELYRQTHPYESLKGGNALAPRHRPEDTDQIRMIPMDSAFSSSPFAETDNKDKYILLYRNRTYLVDGAEDMMVSFMEAHPECLVLYWDEDRYVEQEKTGKDPYFKPDPSADTLISWMYTGSSILVRNSDPAKEAFHLSADGPADVYGLLLRLMISGKGEGFAHIPSVLSGTVDNLIEYGGSPGSSGYKSQLLSDLGIKADFRTAQDPEIAHVVYELPENEPKVSVIIPSKDHPDILERAVASIRSGTDYSNYEIIIIDNGSTEMGQKAYRHLADIYDFDYQYFNSKFNFSHSCNYGADHANGELLLFLNDDTEVIERDWMRNMAGQAIQKWSGAVGARLLYEGTDIIQHAGVTNMAIGPSHKLASLPDDRSYYHGINRYDRNSLAVTGACLMVRKDVFEEVGGFDEKLAVAYNDIDLCMSIQEAGYFNVLRNDAVLWHDESLSRGADDVDEAKRERLFDEEEYLYSKHPQFKGCDPFYSPFLSQDTVYYEVRGDFDWNEKTVLSERTEIASAEENPGMNLTIDRAALKKDPDRSIPVVVLVEGWAFVPGVDNSFYEKTVLLRNSSGRVFGFTSFPRYRSDVAEALESQENCALASFVARILPESLEKGTYTVGVRMEAQGKTYVSWSEVEAVI